MSATYDTADPAAIGAAPALGKLPEWDLADLYPCRDSPELARDLATLAADAAAFRARYEGRLAGLSGAELGGVVAQYERLQEAAGRIMSYAELVRAGNVADAEIARFFQTMHERINRVSTELLFFVLELNRIGWAARWPGSGRGLSASAISACRSTAIGMPPTSRRLLGRHPGQVPAIAFV